MSTTHNGTHNVTKETPGMQLALVRNARGYAQEDVAGKLNLRTRVIELLEGDDYELMAVRPVFIRGYIRGYAKFLDIPSEPLVDLFNSMYSSEGKLEKALWQSRREANTGERAVRLLTAVIAVAAIVAVGVWWQKNRDSQQLSLAKDAHVVAGAAPGKTETETRLTDLSKMHSVFTPENTQITPADNHDA